MAFHKTYNRTKRSLAVTRFQPAPPATNEWLILRCALPECYQVSRSCANVKVARRRLCARRPSRGPPIWGKTSALGEGRVVLERAHWAKNAGRPSGSRMEPNWVPRYRLWVRLFLCVIAHMAEAVVRRGSGRKQMAKEAQETADQRRHSTTFCAHRRALQNGATAAWAPMM